MDITQLKLAELDRDEKSAKKAIKLGEALDRLRSNRDFNLLVVEGYLKNEAIRLVHLKADPNMQSPERQAAVSRDIDAIGVTSNFFTIVSQQAEKAKTDIALIAQEREYYANEEEDGGNNG